MAIDNYTSRHKAQNIFNEYFCPLSKNHLDFNLFDTLNFYEAITDQQEKTLEKIFEEAADKLFIKMKAFDKNQLKLVAAS